MTLYRTIKNTKLSNVKAPAENDVNGVHMKECVFSMAKNYCWEINFTFPTMFLNMLLLHGHDHDHEQVRWLLESNLSRPDGSAVSVSDS